MMSYEELYSKFIDLQAQHIKVLQELVDLRKSIIEKRPKIKIKEKEEAQIRCAKKIGTGGF